MWPGGMMTLRAFRAAGIEPIRCKGWRDRAYEAHAGYRGSRSDLRAVVLHDTGTGTPREKLRDTQSLPWILNGVENRAGQDLRLCHGYISRTAKFYLVYAFRTCHAGMGREMFGLPPNMLNRYSWGLEIESEGGGVKDLTPLQRDLAARVCAVMLNLAELPLRNLTQHKDYAGAVQGKVDTAYDLAEWKQLVRPHLRELRGKAA